MGPSRRIHDRLQLFLLTTVAFLVAAALVRQGESRVLPDPDIAALHTCLRTNGIPDRQFVTHIDAHADGSTPNNETYTYDDLNWQWNKLYGEIKPFAYLVAESASDVSTAVRCSTAQGIRVVAKSGGHSYLKHGFGDEQSFIVDLHRMNSVTVNVTGMEATVGPGTLNGKLQYDLYAAGGFLFPTGVCPTVGVGGFIQGGGYSWFSRLHGLGSDNLLEAEMVDWTGTLVKANSETNPDLFWALRGGGGGNFGIVTSVKLKIYRPPAKINLALASYDFESFPQFYKAWQSWITSDPPGYLVAIILIHKPGMEMYLLSMGGEGGRDELWNILATRFPPPKTLEFETNTHVEYIVRMSQLYSDVPLTSPEQLLNLTRHNGVGWKKVKSMFVSQVLESDEDVARLHELYRDYVGRDWSDSDGAVGEVVIEHYGGAINRMSPTDTAFSHRSTLYEMQPAVFVPGADGQPNDEAVEAMNTFFESTKSLLGHTESYQNYLDEDMADWMQRYYGENLQRLLEVKRMVDPNNVFRNSRSIPVPLP